jgi:hypothetical protein
VVLSKRERYIAIATVSVIGLIMLWQFFIGPELDHSSELSAKIKDDRTQLDNADKLFTASRQAGKKWSVMMAGPLKTNASEAESQVLRMIQGWMTEAGLSNVSINKPDKSEKEKDFSKMTVRATGTGGMNNIGNFLFKIQTANIPVKVTDVTLSTHKEGNDDLSIQVGVATMYLSPDDRKPGAAAPAAARETVTP